MPGIDVSSLSYAHCYLIAIRESVWITLCRCNRQVLVFKGWGKELTFSIGSISELEATTGAAAHNLDEERSYH